MVPEVHSPSPFRRSLPPLGRFSPGLALLVAVGCGGGGGGGTATSSASAGADRTARPYEAVVLTGVVQGGSAEWRQVGGASATILGGLASTALRFVAPEDPSELVFELRAVSGGAVRASDRVTVTVQAAGGAVANLRQRIVVNGGGPERARRADHDPVSQRLFVLDAAADEVLAYDVADPDAPALAGVLPRPAVRPGFQPGPPVDVTAAAGVLAVVHEGESRLLPGRVVFYDPLTLTELSSWSCGAGPIDAEITPDGLQIAVAGAGGLVGGSTADPQGTVTWVRVPAGGPATIDPAQHVRTFSFFAFEGAANTLLQKGVRLPRPQVGVARDLEPRAVTFGPDGAEVYVSLAANNALACIDLDSQLVRDVSGLRRVDWSGVGGEVSGLAGLRPLRYDTGRTTATTVGGQQVFDFDVEAIVSAERGASDDELLVELLAARGPVLPPQNVDSDPELERPFVLAPVGPRLVRARLSLTDGSVEVLGETVVRQFNGAALTSLPNFRASAPGLALHDEAAVDLQGLPLPLDPFGVHVGDAVRVGGELWIADQYRPSLLRVNAAGTLLARFVPQGSVAGGAVAGVESLPAVYSTRVLDGGFAGLAASDASTVLFAVLGRPLDNPDTADDAASRASRIVRVLAVNRSSGSVTAEYAYVLERAGHVVRDADLDAEGRLVVLEEDPSGDFSALFRASLIGATDLRQLGGAYAAVSAALETTEPSALSELAAPVVPLRKSLAVDLGEAGTRATAFVGRFLSPAVTDPEFPLLARADAHGLGQAVLDPVTRRFSGAQPSALDLAFFGASGRRFDGSDRDEGLRLTEDPVQGMRQALDLVAFDCNGEVRIAGADGGAPRIVPGSPGYDETARVGELALDTLVFGNALELVRNERLGRLRISRVDSDPDGDGFAERLMAFGGRSVFLAAPSGSLVWDSGDRLTRKVLARQSEREGRLDLASPEGGLAPQCLALGEVESRRMLFVGCGGSGSVALYDLEHPGVPRFAGFAANSALADPSDLTFVPAGEAPGGRPFLVVVDAAAGTVELLDVLPEPR